MPIPNDIFFGLDQDNSNITFGDIRTIIDNKEEDYEFKLLKLIELRIKRILNEPMLKVKENKDPYLLVSLVSQGIEILGQIFHPASEQEKSKPFREIANKLHQEFPRKLSKKTIKQLKTMWAENKDIDKIDTLSYLLYRYLRNDMTHFFIAKGVYLSYEDIDNFKVIENDNEVYLVINPNWYYNRYIDIFNNYFYNEIKTNKNYRDKALNYIKNAIK